MTFYQKRGIAASLLSHVLIFLRISCIRPLFHVGCPFFSLSSMYSSILSRLLYLLQRHYAVIHFSGVYIQQINFNNSYLVSVATFLEEVLQAYGFLRVVYLFQHYKCSHPSFEVGYVSDSEKVTFIFFLKENVFT